MKDSTKECTNTRFDIILSVLCDNYKIQLLNINKPKQALKGQRMEDTYKYDEQKKTSESNWELGALSFLSLRSIGPAGVVQQNLQLMQKKKTISERPVIPATVWQRLSYFRTFATLPSKTQINCIQMFMINRFLWKFVFSIFYKIVPSTYVYLFLSSYAPESHIFLPKMVPICYGCTWAFIFSGFLSIELFLENILLFLDYLIFGIVYQNPWKRCDQPTQISVEGTQLYCYDMIDFRNKFVNETPVNYGSYYKTMSNETFQLAQIYYMMSRRAKMFENNTVFCAYVVIVWTIISVCYRQIFKTTLWKLLNAVHMILNVVLLIVFIDLMLEYMETRFKKVPLAQPDYINLLTWDSNINILAESTTTLPVVHVLTSRSTDEIEPNRDSLIMVASNSLYLILQGVMSYTLKRFCDNIVGVPILVTKFNSHNLFYFWPIYLTKFYFCDFYTLLFFFINFVVELLSLIITIQCFTEVLKYEWPGAKRWLVYGVQCAISVALNLSNLNLYRITLMVMYIYNTSICTVAEFLSLCFLYPAKRLAEDIRFHYGYQPCSMIVFFLSGLPFLYTFKIFSVIVAFHTLCDIIGFDKSEEVPFYKELIYIPIIPIAFGVLYATYRIVYKDKKGWRQLFTPVSEWGPIDPTERRLRNLYDSREYIRSQAPRELSRHLMDKAEFTKYKLDIKYGARPQEFRFEDEKKCA